LNLPGAFLIELSSGGPEETQALGEKIARRLGRGSVVALRGGLGSGKTCLAKGIARGLGITELITSPSYAVICEYLAGDIPLYHIDAYRLGGDEDFENTGGLELLYGGGISIVEWSERIPRSLPPEAAAIEIIPDEKGNRLLRIQSPELEALFRPEEKG
jgi:tRNA threonylcarbamoyladenosine biosynthesis protein TsaE